MEIAATAGTTSVVRHSPKPVSHPSDGLDGVIPQLVPQVADGDVELVRTRVETVPPDTTEQLLSAENLLGMLEELFRQCELPCGEVDLDASDVSATGSRIEAEVAVGPRSTRRPLAVRSLSRRRRRIRASSSSNLKGFAR
jgi:hypothetical protein